MQIVVFPRFLLSQVDLSAKRRFVFMCCYYCCVCHHFSSTHYCCVCHCLLVFKSLLCFQELGVSSVYVLATKMQKSAVTPIFASLFLSNCFYLCFLCVSLFSSHTEIIVLFAVFNTDTNTVTETNTITYRQELVKMSKRFTCSCEA